MGKWERNIPISELVWKVVLSWKKIIICALAFAVAATGLRYAMDMSSYKSAIAKKQQEVQQTTSGEELVSVKFSETEVQQIRDVQSLQYMMNETRDYMENSILLGINPYQEEVLSLKYYVDSDYQSNYTKNNEMDYTQNVVKAYSDYIENGNLAQNILTELELDCEVQYVEELITVKSESVNTILSIEVVYPDTAVLGEISVVVKTLMDSQEQVFAEQIGAHSLKLLNENISVRVDEKLVSSQKYYQDLLYNYRVQINNLKAVMSTEQINVLNGNSGTNKEESAVTSEESKPSISVQYLILGLGVGAFLSLVWLVLKTLFESRLQFEIEMEDGFGLKMFGGLREEREQCAIDRFLLRLRDKRKKQFSADERMTAICTNLELTCKNKEISRLFLTGTEMEQIENAFVEKIKEHMQNVGIEVIYGDNICYNVDALRQMADVKNVVLMEKVGTSRYGEMEREINLVREQNGKVIGCIVIA